MSNFQPGMDGDHGYRLERAQVVPRGREEVFPFFADPMNLERITPPFLHFRIVTPPPLEMRPGLLIDYRLRLYGIPLGWRTRIEAWEPPHGFTDVQVSGPYRSWVHRHEFVEVSGGTEVRDCVDYVLPFGPLGRIAHPLVRASLDRIFAYRRGAIARAFGITREGR